MIEDMGDVSHSVGIENWFIIAARGWSYNWLLTVKEPLVTLVNSSDFDHKGYSSYYQFIHSVVLSFKEKIWSDFLYKIEKFEGPHQLKVSCQTTF